MLLSCIIFHTFPVGTTRVNTQSWYWRVSHSPRSTCSWSLCTKALWMCKSWICSLWCTPHRSWRSEGWLTRPVTMRRSCWMWTWSTRRTPPLPMRFLHRLHRLRCSRNSSLKLAPMLRGLNRWDSFLYS